MTITQKRNPRKRSVALEETSEAGSDSDQEEVIKVQEEGVKLRSEPRPKRTAKPTIRLT